MYTVCNPEVGSKGCHHAPVVSNPDDRTMGPFSDVAACFPFRNHVDEAGLCFSFIVYPFLVRDPDALPVILEDEEERTDEREEKV